MKSGHIVFGITVKPEIFCMPCILLILQPQQSRK